MHRLPNQKSVARFRFVALLLLASRLLMAASPVLLVCALIDGDRELTHLALALIGAALLLTIIQYFGAARCRCPLCLGPPLAHIACIKSRNARRWLGSYRLRVAISVMLEGEFRCPYCGEFTAIAVRRRRHGRF